MYEMSVHNLQVNPAQMRTRISAEELAQLALQVQGGIDPDMELILTPAKGGLVRVISGHRRWLALMIAWLAKDRPGDGLGGMFQTIQELCTIEDGFVPLDEALYTKLTEMVPQELTVPYRLWTGPADDEVILLMRANLGAEEPDLVGQALALKAAIERGVGYQALAEVTGHMVEWVKAMVKLAALPKAFKVLANDGLLDISIVFDLEHLDKARLKALAKALAQLYADDKKHAEGSGGLRDYTTRVQLAALQLGNEPGVVDRKGHGPTTHNLSKIVSELWQTAKENNTALLYHAMAEESLAGSRFSNPEDFLEILNGIPGVTEHIKGLERYAGMVYSITTEAMTAILPELDCATCIFAQLPEERLKYELPLQCRENPAGMASGPCLQWTPKGEPFAIRTPYYWREGGKVITSLKKLQQAWQAQANHVKNQAAKSHRPGASASMDEQRGKIQYYMENHTKWPFMVEHPWATPCARCRHRLSESPVKSAPDAPHCAWARGKRRLFFDAYVLEGKGAAVAEMGKTIPEGQGLVPFDQWQDLVAAVPYLVPACRQFAPDDEWPNLIPEADTEPPFADRDVLYNMIIEVAENRNRNVYSTDSRAALQMLTGRPMSASAGHRGLFKSQFMKERNRLSIPQLWTLLQWLWLEWLRVQARTSAINMPMGGCQTMHANVMDFTTAVAMSKHTEDNDDSM